MDHGGVRAERTPLTCFRLHAVLEGTPVTDFDDFIDLEIEGLREEQGPVAGPDFVAKIYLITTAPRAPGWADFVTQAFNTLTIPTHASTGALLIVRLSDHDDGYFAFTFGLMGRHLLRDDAPRRAYGLRTALNLIYPVGGGRAPGRVTAVDTTRRAAGVVRASRGCHHVPERVLILGRGRVGIQGTRRSGSELGGPWAPLQVASIRPARRQGPPTALGGPGPGWLPGRDLRS